MKGEIVTLNGSFGEENIGDGLLLLSILNYFIKDENIAEINILTANCKNTLTLLKKEKYFNKKINLIYSGRWGLQEPDKELKYSFKWILKLILALKKSRLHLIGPGNLLKDDSNPFFAIFWLSKALISIFFLKKIAFIGIGVANINHFHSNLFIRFIMNRSKFITTRDNKSISKLEKLHVNKSLIRSYPDLVFSIAPLFSSTSKALSRKIQKVGLNLKYFSKKHFDDEILQKYKQSITSFLILLSKINNYEYVFYSLANDPNQDGQDLEIYREFRNECLKYNIQISNFDYDNYSMLINDIHTCDVFIGTRFHSIILATQGCVPSIGISYDCKLENYMKEAGIGEYSVNVEDVTEPMLLHLWDNLVVNYDVYYKKLINLNFKNRKLVMKHFDMCNSIQANNEI